MVVVPHRPAADRFAGRRAVVFPEAEAKFFLTASAETRAKRRHDELVAKGQTISFEETLADVKKLLLANTPTPIHYPKDAPPKPKDVLATDAVIEKYPFGVKDIEIVPVEKIFE